MIRTGNGTSRGTARGAAVLSVEVFVSVQTVSEPRLPARYRCIVDVNNPRRGSLGAASLRPVALVQGLVRPLRCP